MKSNKTTAKISTSTRDKLLDYKRQLSAIEGKDLTIDEIIERMSSGDDILPRLKQGALARRKRC